MCWYLSMNNLLQDAVKTLGFIRLQCAEDLQQALDDKYTMDQWLAKTPDEAFNAIKMMTVQPTNEAAEKEVFYNIRQGVHESIGSYFVRATQVAANSSFRCPSCKHGLEDYLLLSKLVAGLNDPVLKREAFRAYETFTEVNKLKMFCASHESSAPKLSYSSSSAGIAAVGSGEEESEVWADDDEVAGAVR